MKKEKILQVILSNDSLREFILSLKIEKEQEKFLLEKLPNMTSEERIKLMEILEKVYVLDKEKTASLERVKEQIGQII
jgi:hypothetical protein